MQLISVSKEGKSIGKGKAKPFFLLFCVVGIWCVCARARVKLCAVVTCEGVCVCVSAYFIFALFNFSGDRVSVYAFLIIIKDNRSMCSTFTRMY
jgi:hypothetical protein